MRLVETIRTTGVYRAPRGQEHAVGDLPYYRERDDATGATVVWSEWQLDPEDVRAFQMGGVLNIGIVGMEPIPPIAVRIMPPDVDTSED